MMQDLRLVLVVVGAAAIVALLWHGLWASRAERSPFFRDRLVKREKEASPDALLDDPDEGVSEVRVAGQRRVSGNDETQGMQCTSPVSSADRFSCQKQPVSDHNDSQPELSGSRSFEHLSAAIRKDPLIDSAALSLSEEWVSEPRPVSPRHPVANSKQCTGEALKQETVLVLHVAAHHGSVISGELLLRVFLRSGFRFGEMGIFHCHADSAKDSPVLFSLANMIKPGSFDLEAMSGFSTPGVSMFMVLPSHGAASQNFKLMLQTAQRIADDLGGVVLDDERRLITPQKLEIYKTRIREVSDGA